ncbi:MAG: Smr/MutS family protein [Desulfobacteraceae bacterium]|nr:Smr/MutS family protein [Desulfobacteraceae bacterium]MCB9495126.1 Smr/MutS family protein [Desulfobacteraceae bacterium]
MSGFSNGFSNSPFEDYRHVLTGLVKNKKKTVPWQTRENKKSYCSVKKDDDLFLKEMSDVVPVKGKKKIGGSFNTRKSYNKIDYYCEKKEVLKKLEKLLDSGEGFEVSKTPEYCELIGAGVCEETAKKLHEGKFSVQAYIDLHGFSRIDADEIVRNFLEKSFRENKNAVLIVHGRGLSSKNEPVLKNLVQEILSSNYWRRRIFACASAKSTDGGSGGTYVLFRKKPLSKNQEKKLLKKQVYY